MDSIDIVKSRYQNRRTAGRYDDARYNDWQGRLNNWTVWRKLQRALNGVPSGGRILDIPCGTGRFSWHLSGAGYETVACDVSLDMLAVAKSAGGPDANAPKFMQGDLFNLPFRDQEFDAVVCVRFMNLVDRSVRIKTVRALARLAPLLIVSYYHPYKLKYAGRWLRKKAGLYRKALSTRLTRRAFLDEIKETGCHLRECITVSPLLSEEWLAVLETGK